MHIKYLPCTLSTYPASFLMPEEFKPVCMLQLQPHQCRTDLKYCFPGHATHDSTPFLQQYNGTVKNETQCLRDSSINMAFLVTGVKTQLQEEKDSEAWTHKT